MKRLSLFLVLLMSSVAMGQQRFTDVVGPVGVKDAVTAVPMNIPYITWGGDAATFHANGGLTTSKGSTYEKMGLNIKLTKGDDFVAQVRDYLGGNPFLRLTFGQLGQASEVLNADPRTKPVVILQLSWSAGDHIVARKHIKNLNDLVQAGKKTKIAVMANGPHVGLVYDVLLAAQTNKDNIELVWTTDLSGEKGPAELFKKDPSIDACCVITPDMIGLTGGLESTGAVGNAEGNVEGSHVIVSTQQMSRAIADVYVVRADWYSKNKPLVEKFVAGYLKSCEDIVAMRKAFNGSKLNPDYKALLTTCQTAFGKDVIPTLEVEGHGLLLDCTFVGLPGQVSFFEDAGNLNGFDPKVKNALDLGTGWGFATNRGTIAKHDLDYNKLASLAGIAYTAPKIQPRIKAESIDVFPDSNLDDRTIFSFTINFEPNESEFSATQYAASFERAIQSASTFGNAVVIVRGHADPTQTLIELIKAGMAKGILQRTGEPGSFKYYMDGKELSFARADKIIQLVKAGAFEGTSVSPTDTMLAAFRLSENRAKKVVDQVSKYALEKNITFDASQIHPVGVGIAEPLIAKPRNGEEARKNMRVEFRLIRVPAEAVKSGDFDY